MIALAGMVLLAFGLLSGLVLVLSPLGLLPPASGVTLWVLFPLFSLAGYFLFVLPSGTAGIRRLSRVAGAGLLLLALVAAGGLLLQALTLVTSEAGTGSLWYVMLVGMVLGTPALLTTQDPASGA